MARPTSIVTTFDDRQRAEADARRSATDTPDRTRRHGCLRARTPRSLRPSHRLVRPGRMWSGHGHPLWSLSPRWSVGLANRPTEQPASGYPAEPYRDWESSEPRMASTPTTKSQVQAYQFVLRRMQSALVRRDAVMLHDPMQRHSRATSVGVVLGVVGLLAFLVIGLFKPAPRLNKETQIAISKETGQVYVVDNAGPQPVLVPMTNLASARLLWYSKSNPDQVPERRRRRTGRHRGWRPDTRPRAASRSSSASPRWPSTRAAASPASRTHRTCCRSRRTASTRSGRSATRSTWTSSATTRRRRTRSRPP